jgi:hypothetical protein
MGILLWAMLLLFQDSVSEAKARLSLIETQRKQSEAIAAQVAEKAAQELAEANAKAVQEQAVQEAQAAVEADAFEEVKEEVEQEPQPVITFERAVQSASVMRRSEKIVTENWLVTTAYCPACPAAKARFKKAGNPESRIISPQQAFDLHGQVVKSVPFEYEVKVATVLLQPPTYRLANKMKSTLDGNHTPSKSAILKHLRTGGPHAGKHWQQWNLEVWDVKQLYALHDDDHDDVVPTFEAEDVVVATVENSRGVQDVVAALAAHLIESSGQKQDEQAYGSFFDFEVDVPDTVRDAIAKVLTSKSMSFPSAGLKVDWSGDSRSLILGKDKIEISPPVTVSVNKWVFSYSASLRGMWYEPDLSSVTFDLQGAPDLKVVLK